MTMTVAQLQSKEEEIKSILERLNIAQRDLALATGELDIEDIPEDAIEIAITVSWNAMISMAAAFEQQAAATPPEDLVIPTPQ